MAISLIGNGFTTSGATSIRKDSRKAAPRNDSGAAGTEQGTGQYIVDVARERAEGTSVFRGLMFGLLLSIPLWGGLIWGTTALFFHVFG